MHIQRDDVQWKETQDNPICFQVSIQLRLHLSLQRKSLPTKSQRERKQRRNMTVRI